MLVDITSETNDTFVVELNQDENQQFLHQCEALYAVSCIAFLEFIRFYYMDNSILSETRTLVFSIFSLVKILKSYVPNFPDVRARPKEFSASLFSLVVYVELFVLNLILVFKKFTAVL